MFFGGIVLILLFLIAVKLLIGLTPPAPDEDAARAAERTKAHEALVAENAAKLSTYAWVDKAKGSVQIPIGRAIDLTVAELAGRPPAPAGPIVPPAAPAAAPEAAPAAALESTPAAPQPAPAN